MRNLFSEWKLSLRLMGVVSRQLSELLSIPAVTIFKMAKSGRVPYLFVSVAVCDFVHEQSPTGSEIAVAKSLSINSYKHVCG